MLTASLALAAVAALACAIVYGTDVFAALVLRPALAALDDGTLTQAAGRIHQYADQRMPVPGAASIPWPPAPTRHPPMRERCDGNGTTSSAHASPYRPPLSLCSWPCSC
jgi:hypothetical protein